MNKKFDIGADKNRIALMQIGKAKKTRIEFNLGDKNTLDGVNKGVDDMRYLNSAGSHIGDALRKAREEVGNGHTEKCFYHLKLLMQNVR